MATFDLHIHSEYSADGEFALRDIVRRCGEAELSVFALTDHNSVRGVGDAVEAARGSGIGFIPGIEIDCNYRGTDLHLLGYGIDWRSPDFARLEESVAAKVMDSFGEMLDNLRRLGFGIDAETVLAAAGGKLPTGELIAEVMLSDEKYHTPLLRPYMEGGGRSDMPYINFYLDYFAQGRPAFVPVEFMPFREAVELVRDNGGIPVVAHPGLNFRGRETVAEELLRRGAAGLEVFNNYHDPEQAAWFASLAKREKAFLTCGSDFHGKTKPRIGIGQFPQDDRFAADLSGFVAHAAVIRA